MKRGENMSVFVTGDCHGEWNKLHFYSDKFNEDDFVIVCGDFGIWHDVNGEGSELDELSELGVIVCFCDGNHENFDRLYSDEFEVVDFHGGKAHKIRENIYHLMRGNVFEFDGKKFFVFGGASSHDIEDGILDPDTFACEEDFRKEYTSWWKSGKRFRVKGYSWWEQELPSEEEMAYGKQCLAEHNNEVDFVISHCAPQEVASVYSHGGYKSDRLTAYLNEIAMNTKFTSWYMGHYHQDRRIMSKFNILYHRIERIV